MKFPGWFKTPGWLLIVVAAHVRVRWQLLAVRRPADLQEDAYVPLAAATGGK